MGSFMGVGHFVPMYALCLSSASPRVGGGVGGGGRQRAMCGGRGDFVGTLQQIRTTVVA